MPPSAPQATPSESGWGKPLPAFGGAAPQAAPTVSFALPDGVSVADVAGLGARWAGRFLDTLALWVPPLGIVLIAAELPTGIAPTVGLVLVLGYLLAYFVGQSMLAETRGQTLGKVVLRTQVVRIDGRPADFLRAFFVRELVLTALAITQGGAILNALFLLGSSRRMLQDHLLGTVVVDLRTARPRAIDATSVARTFA